MIVKLTNYGKLQSALLQSTAAVKTSPADLDVPALASAFRALSNPNRLAMYLELLRHRERSVKSCALQDLMDLLDIGAPTVSHHTKELVTAGLIEVKREGKFIRCRLNDSMRGRLARFFTSKNER